MSNKNDDQTEKHFQHHRWDTIYSGEATDYHPPDSKVLSFLENLDTGKMLDVGCGAGNLSIALSKKGWRTTGIDISPKAISAGNKAALKQKVEVTFIVDDASTWQPDDLYDLITCNFGVPPEIEKRHDVYATIRKAIKPGGIVFFVIGKHDNKKILSHFSGYNSLNIEELKLAFNEFDFLKSVEVELEGHRHGGREIEHGKKPAFIFMASSPKDRK